MLPVLAIAVATSISILTYVFMTTRKPKGMPPGPFSWPFVGNFFDFSSAFKLHLKADYYYRKYGPMVGLQMAAYPTVLISDVKLLREIWIDKSEAFPRASWLPSYSNNKPSLFFNTDEDWKRLRILVIESFEKLGYTSTGLEDKVQKEAAALVEKLSKVKERKYQFDLLFNKATGNIIMTILFGHRCFYDDQEFGHLLQNLSAFLYHLGNFNPFQFLPAYFKLLLPIFKPVVFKNALQFKKALQTLTEKNILEHRETFNKNDLRDLTDLILDSGLDEGNFRAAVRDLFIGGIQLSSSTLLWAFVFMTKHPEIQDKCRAEIFNVLGNSRPVHMADKEKLPYLSATIMEIQRRASVVALAPTVQSNIEKAEIGGFELPEKTLILYNQYSMHHDPKYWDKPQEFMPERFLSEDGLSTMKPEAFVPFSIGPRSCLGEHLAEMELFLFFSSLIQKFRFTAVDEASLPTEETVPSVLHPGNFSVYIDKMDD